MASITITINIITNTFFITSFAVPVFSILILALLRSGTPHPFSAGTEIAVFIFVYHFNCFIYLDSYINILSFSFKEYGKCISIYGILVAFILIVYGTKLEKKSFLAFRRLLYKDYQENKFKEPNIKENDGNNFLKGLKYRKKFFHSMTSTYGFPTFRLMFCWIFIVATMGLNIFFIFGDIGCQ